MESRNIANLNHQLQAVNRARAVAHLTGLIVGNDQDELLQASFKPLAEAARNMLEAENISPRMKFDTADAYRRLIHATVQFYQDNQNLFQDGLTVNGLMNLNVNRRAQLDQTEMSLLWLLQNVQSVRRNECLTARRRERSESRQVRNEVSLVTSSKSATGGVNGAPTSEDKWEGGTIEEKATPAMEARQRLAERDVVLAFHDHKGRPLDSYTMGMSHLLPKENLDPNSIQDIDIPQLFNTLHTITLDAAEANGFGFNPLKDPLCELYRTDKKGLPIGKHQSLERFLERCERDTKPEIGFYITCTDKSGSYPGPTTKPHERSDLAMEETTPYLRTMSSSSRPMSRVKPAFSQPQMARTSVSLLDLP